MDDVDNFWYKSSSRVSENLLGSLYYFLGRILEEYMSRECCVEQQLESAREETRYVSINRLTTLAAPRHRDRLKIACLRHTEVQRVDPGWRERQA